MGRNKNIEVADAFELFYANSDDKYQKARCKSCGFVLAKGATRQHQHLEKCPIYPKETAHHTSEAPEAVSKPKKRSRIQVPAIDKAKKEKLDRMAARAVYCGARPFDIFEKPEMKAFLHELNPAYSPPGKKRIVEELLDAEYDYTKAVVMDKIDKSACLNFITDRSTSIALQLRWDQGCNAST